jgi:hypothetical protein
MESISSPFQREMTASISSQSANSQNQSREMESVFGRNRVLYPGEKRQYHKPEMLFLDFGLIGCREFVHL